MSRSLGVDGSDDAERLDGRPDRPPAHREAMRDWSGAHVSEGDRPRPDGRDSGLDGDERDAEFIFAKCVNRIGGQRDVV
jgi:hypothetical protein